MIKVLPYELEFRQPTAEGLRVVTEFSKKTGDYGSLSMTDLNVLAVTYDLELEQQGTDHLNAEPVTKRSVEFYKPSKGIPKGDKKIAGFFTPEDRDDPSPASAENDFTAFQFWREPIAEVPIDFDLQDLEVSSDSANPSDSPFSKEDLANLDSFLMDRSFICSFEVSFVDLFLANLLVTENTLGLSNLGRWHRQILSYKPPSDETFGLSLPLIKEKIALGKDFSAEDVVCDDEDGDEAEHVSSDEGIIIEDVDSDKEEEEEEDDDEGWITPSNLKEKKNAMTGADVVDAPVKVACITTDFAMQNVLKQIGLNIIGANGMVIKVIACLGRLK